MGTRLENPYLAEFDSLMPEWRVPPRLRKFTFERYVLRQRMVAKYAWAIPTTEAIEVLLAHSPLVEMGAGTGYWAWLVRQAGGDILAFDRYPPPDGRNRWHAGEQQWTEVKPGGPRILARHRGRTLFLCWPPEDEPMTAQCLQVYGGDTFVYAGEPPAGPEGGDALADWEPLRVVHLPQWESVRDLMIVFRRQSSPPGRATDPGTHPGE